MSQTQSKTGRRTAILGGITAEEFVGRKREFDEILRRAADEKAERGLLVPAVPAAGASELLRQIYDEVFAARGDRIPFYFAVNRSDRTIGAAARRFLHQFLLQTVAFRRGEPRLLDAAPEIREIAELAAPADGVWINRLAVALESSGEDEPAFVRQALSAPLRAAAAGAVSFVLIDDLHQAETLENGNLFVEELNRIYARSTVPFVIAGHRRFLLGATQGAENSLDNTSVLQLDLLSVADAGVLTENLARRHAVAINEQTRDLIVQQLERSPTFINDLILAARDRRAALDSFQNCQQIYAEEILGGRINRYFAAIFDRIAPNVETQREILDVLHDALAAENDKSSVEFWRKRVSVSAPEFYRILRGLHLHEIIRLNASVIETDAETIVGRDYVKTRHDLEIETGSRALVFSNFLAGALKRAPQLMARHYRRRAALDLRGLTTAFNLQSVPQSLFDYDRFKRFYKGADAGEIARNLQNETDLLTLPQTVFAAKCAAYYPPIAGIAGGERSVVALGFEAGNYAEANQIVWIAAEIESKLEATVEMTAFWLDRLEAVAAFCNFTRSRFWLVAPEGFSDAASRLLKERGAFGSSFRQVELLAERLNAENVLRKNRREETTGGEYELVVPMGDDTEIIAAKAIESFAQKHDFSPAAINQIKTALVEACINAAEHSLSPDQKIYQKFAFDNGKLTITISNRGLKMPAHNVGQNGISASNGENFDGRRGLGLKIMRKLMDEVEIETTDDGTRIRMTKLLKNRERN